MCDRETVSILLTLTHSRVEEVVVRIPAVGGAFDVERLFLFLTSLKEVFPDLLDRWFVLEQLVFIITSIVSQMTGFHCNAIEKKLSVLWQ